MKQKMDKILMIHMPYTFSSLSNNILKTVSKTKSVSWMCLMETHQDGL